MITGDEATYSDPEVFKPERFLEEDGSLNRDDVGYVFGVGRGFVVLAFHAVIGLTLSRQILCGIDGRISYVDATQLILNDYYQFGWQ